MCCRDVLLFAPSQWPGPREKSEAEHVGTWSMLAQDPPERPLALCPKAKKGNMGAPGRATSHLPSHPGKPESFPYVCGWGFLGVCLPQASPGRCVSKVCGPGVSPPQGRAGWAGWGKSRQCRLPGRAHALRGVSFVLGGYLSRHMFLLGAEVQAGRSSSHTGHAQLSELQAGLADGHCHFTASHSGCG